MSAYVPAWRRRQLEKEAETAALPPIRKPRFLGNALGGPNVLENTGARFSPRSPGAAPTRAIRKLGPTIEPNSSPILKPTHNLTKVQPLFRNKVLRAMGPTRKALTKKLKRQGKTKKQIRKWLKKKV